LIKKLKKQKHEKVINHSDASHKRYFL